MNEIVLTEDEADEAYEARRLERLRADTLADLQYHFTTVAAAYDKLCTAADIENNAGNGAAAIVLHQLAATPSTWDGQ